MERAGVGVAVLITAVVVVLLLGQSGSRSSHAFSLCAETGSPFGPFDIQAYEAEDWLTSYGTALELAGFNALFPELPGFAVPELESGPRLAGPDALLDPYIPPTLLKGIAWLESTWMQADYDIEWGEIGPVLISPDCGYGMMQVTTGMQNISGVPNLEQAMIGGHYAFNAARGARILAEKWNLAPESRPQVGERDPTRLEDWYYAVWGYNGFAFTNHPLNPDYAAWPRVPFSCGLDDDGFGHDRSSYPYQELVLGCLERPPLASQVDQPSGGELVLDEPIWEPLVVHLPDLSEPAFGGPLQLDNWDDCALNLECAAMDIPTPSPFHSDPVVPNAEREDILGIPVLSLSTSELILLAISGSDSSSESVTVFNPGTGVLAWRLASSASWLKLSRVQGVSLGSDLGSRNQTFIVSADAELLPPGIHQAQIVVESLYASSAPALVTVTLSTSAAGLIEAPDGELYALQNGLKRNIPDAATFEAYGFSLEDVIPASDAYLATLTSGHPLVSVLASGRLIQAPGEGSPIYVMDGGVRRQVDPAVMALCSYGADAVASLSQATVDSVPSGLPLMGRPCPRLSFEDGTILQGADGWIWVVQEGSRRQIVGDNALVECGFRQGDVDSLADSLIVQLSVGPVISDCSGNDALLMTGDGSIYIVRAGLARLVPDVATFEAVGFSLEKVLPVGDLSIPVGEPLLSVLATGRLIQSDEGGSQYVMEQDVKRRIISPDDMTACQYELDAVTTLSAATIDSIASGVAVQPPTCPRLNLGSGILLQGEDEAVWVTMGSVRKLVLGPEVLASCGYLSGNINPVSDAIMVGLTVGAAVAPCSTDGSLVWNSDGSVHQVRSGWKRLVPNPTTFEANGFSWSDVVPVPDDWLHAGRPLLDVTATGWLVRSPSGGPLYVMDAGAKRLVNEFLALAVCGYDLDAVSLLSEATVEALPVGVPLTAPPCPRPEFADGILLVGSDGEMWVVQDGQRRRIASLEAFSRCGYDLGYLDTVADGIITSLPEMADLLGPPCP